MSDLAHNEQEFSDIELCYKAMGLSFSDNPEQVEKTYLKLKDEYTRAMRSSDTSERTTATENLKQLEELFTTIKDSVIYKDYAKEYEKYKAAKAEKIAARKQKQQEEQPAVKDDLASCPYCNKPISSKLKVCIYCHAKILSPAELMMAKLFTTRNIVILTVVILLVVTAVVVALNPQLLKR